MFDFLKRKKTDGEVGEKPNPITQTPVHSAKKTGWFGRLKAGLNKTRNTFSTGLANLFLGKKELTPALLTDIETALLSADVGVETTTQLIDNLTQQLSRKELNNTESAFHVLQDAMKNILLPYALPIEIPENIKPFVILVVGVNGSGKTTTIGKLAHYFKQNHKEVMLAAGDTFRAAAIEQLDAWGERNSIPVIAQQPGADPAAVVFDAMEAAKARGIDVLIADTAGRLHTHAGLMAELKKIKRVLAKIDPTAPHETLIVLDATLGQNTLSQVKQFNEGVGLTGIALTKLDGTAKGGILFAIAQQTKIPIRFIGIGEGIDDVRPFEAEEFVSALFSD